MHSRQASFPNLIGNLSAARSAAAPHMGHNDMLKYYQSTSTVRLRVPKNLTVWGGVSGTRGECPHLIIPKQQIAVAAGRVVALRGQQPWVSLLIVRAFPAAFKAGLMEPHLGDLVGLGARPLMLMLRPGTGMGLLMRRCF